MTFTITQMKKLNKEAGGYWFSKESMSFFDSKVETPANAKGYFITSEQFDEESPRKFTLRWFNPISYTVDTIGEFQEYETLEQAKNARKYQK